MSQNTAPAAHNQRPIEDVLDFCVELSRRMRDVDAGHDKCQKCKYLSCTSNNNN